MEKKISKATMSRFPVYLKALRKMQHEGKETCLSSELFEITGIQDTTIRRDFTYLSKTDNFGRRGRGYDVKHLIDGLSEVLGLRLDEPIIDKLEETFPSDCKIAILAISENVQETVDRLMKLGIKGIVDFTHSHFMVQEGVEVQTVDVVVAIQELVIKMKSNDQE